MQLQTGMEKPAIFVSHNLSDQAMWSWKQLGPYFLGKFFTVCKDHKNLVCLCYSSITELVRWRVILSEFRFVIYKTLSQIDSQESILPGSISWKSRRDIYIVSRVFSGLEGIEETEIPEVVIEEEDLDVYGITTKSLQDITTLMWAIFSWSVH